MMSYIKRLSRGRKENVRALVVGLTGGFGTGKTTVAQMLAACGATVLDSDRVVRGLLAATGSCYRAVVRRFGEDIVGKDGEIDKARLAALVFADQQGRRALEKIIHPKVCAYLRAKIKEFRRGSGGVLVLEIPLLFEVGMERAVDRVIVVRARQKDQVGRALRGRFSDRREILARIKAQWPLSQKLKCADIVIDNRGTLAETKKTVQAVWQMLQTF